jgi:DNA-binding MarR family transcriptional regulator
MQDGDTVAPEVRVQKKQEFPPHSPIENRAKIDNKRSLDSVEEGELKHRKEHLSIEGTSLNPLALFPGIGFSVRFRLLLVERICRRRMALFCRKNYGLESNLFLILLAASEGHLQQGILAGSLGINKNAMVFFIDNLEARRLIKRVPNPDNRRERFVECTPKGKQIIADTKAHYPEIARWGFYPLTEIQIEQLRILLTQIIEGVQSLPCPLVRLKKTKRTTTPSV